MAYLILLISAIMSATFIIAATKKIDKKILRLLKALSSVCFLLVAVFTYLLSRGNEKSLGVLPFSLLLAGLCLGAAGDILLAQKEIVAPEKKNLFFVLGLSGFLIGHLLFIVFFYLLSAFNFWTIIIAVNISAISIILISILHFNLKKLILPVIAYAIILSSMVAAAAGNVIAAPSGFSIAMLVAALLFFLSDAVLLFIYFKNNPPNFLTPINLTFYYLAQNLIAFSPFLITLTFA